MSKLCFLTLFVFAASYSNLCFAAQPQDDWLDKYLGQFSKIAFKSEARSKQIGGKQTQVKVYEKWKIDFKNKRLWKLTESDQKTGLYSELLIGDQILNLTVDESTRNARAVNSWATNPKNYWVKEPGYGDVGIVFGILWNGNNYFRLDEFAKFGETSIKGEYLILRYENDLYRFVGEFNRNKCFCPRKIEFVENIDHELALSQDREISQVIEFEEPSKVAGTWIPSSYKVTLESPARKSMLPSNLKMVNGGLIMTNEEIQGAKDYVEIPKSKVETRIQLKEISTTSISDFNLTGKIKDGMKVTMNDVPYLPHTWNGKKAVPKIDPDFEQQATVAEFNNQPKIENSLPVWTYLLLIGFATLFASIFVRGRFK